MNISKITRIYAFAHIVLFLSPTHAHNIENLYFALQNKRMHTTKKKQPTKQKIPRYGLL